MARSGSSRRSKDRDQLHRMPLGGRPVLMSDFGADISGFKVSDDRSRVIVWADTRDCPDIACAATTFPAKPEGSGREYDQMFVRHWDTWVEPGVKSRIFSYPIVNGKLTGMGTRVTGPLVGDTPSKPFGGGEEIDISRRRPHGLFRASRSRADRADLDQPRHLHGPRRRQRRAGQPHRPQRRHRHAADAVARRPHPGLCLDGSRRLRGRPPGGHAARSRHRPDPRAHRRLGPLGQFAGLGPRRPQPARHGRGRDGRSGVAGRRRQRRDHPADRQWHLGQCRPAARRRRVLHAEQHHDARRSVPRRRARPARPADQRQPRPARPARPGDASRSSPSRAPTTTGVGLQAEAAAHAAATANCRSPSSSTADRRAASATAGPTAGTRASSPRPVTPWSASISTARPATARPSPTASPTTGAASRSRI